MSAHYKQPLDWNEKLLEDCKNTIDKWYEVYLPSNVKTVLDEDILSPLYDDLNTPGYIANLHQLYDKAKKGNDNDKGLFVYACNFIGILNKTKEEWIKFKKKKSPINEDDILEMITLRNKAREDKNYKEADIIRDKLLDKGVLIEDKDGKTNMVPQMPTAPANTKNYFLVDPVFWADNGTELGEKWEAMKAGL